MVHRLDGMDRYWCDSCAEKHGIKARMRKLRFSERMGFAGWTGMSRGVPLRGTPDPDKPGRWNFSPEDDCDVPVIVEAVDGTVHTIPAAEAPTF